MGGAGALRAARVRGALPTFQTPLPSSWTSIWGLDTGQTRKPPQAAPSTQRERPMGCGQPPARGHCV